MSSLPLQAAQSNGLHPSSSNYGLAYFPSATVTPSRSLALAAWINSASRSSYFMTISSESSSDSSSAGGLLASAAAASVILNKAFL